MRSLHFLRIFATSALITISCAVFSQQTLTNLIVGTGNSYSDPDDFVELSVYDPNSQSQASIGTVYTQSIQCVATESGILYVTAADSIASFDIDNRQKLNVAAVSGTNQLYIYEDKLFVSIQYPEVENFLKIYNKESLELIKSVPEISTEAAGMLAIDGNLYIAVPGGYANTVGSLAVVDASTGNFIHEYNFGAEAVGIYNLFQYEDKLLAVCKTPYLGTTGSLLLFDLNNQTHEIFTFNNVIGKGIGIKDNLLYLFLDYGIGTIDLETMTVTSQIVADPGSANYIDFVSGALDATGERIYAATTDYWSFGTGFIYDLNGNQMGNFEAGISAEALTFDSRTNSSLAQNDILKVSIYPNPATDFIVIHHPELSEKATVNIVDNTGRLVFSQNISTTSPIQLPSLTRGLYHISVVGNDSKVFVQKLMIQ